MIPFGGGSHLPQKIKDISVDQAFHPPTFNHIKAAVFLLLFIRRAEEARRTSVGASSACDVGADQDVKYISVSRYLIEPEIR
jgi:hypothetical protein